jgi:hypothetical protein
VAYVRLSEAQFVNVGTVLPLPLHLWWRLTSLQVSGIAQGRGSIVVAGVTSGLSDGNTAHRAKGARSTATPME